MRASVHIHLPGWKKRGKAEFQVRCEELGLQARSTNGECGSQTDAVFDISNKRRLGFSEVELLQTMIDGVNTLFREDLMMSKTVARLGRHSS